MDSRLIDDTEAADVLGVKVQTLRVWRGTGRYGIPFVKIGRAVRYRMSDLKAFIESRMVSSTNEADGLKPFDRDADDVSPDPLSSISSNSKQKSVVAPPTELLDIVDALILDARTLERRLESLRKKLQP